MARTLLGSYWIDARFAGLKSRGQATKDDRLPHEKLVMTLLDSNTLICYLKGIEPVVVRFQALSPRTLKTGSARRRAVLSGLLAGLKEVPFDQPAALEAARIRVELESRGLKIGPMDLMIAGTALSRLANWTH